MKKILSLVLFAILVLAMSVTALAVSEDCVITVDGVEYTDFAEGWTAGLRATAENENVVNVVFYADWKADENGSFGSGHGFEKGAIYITKNIKDMCIDFNGHTIDRGLLDWKNFNDPIDTSKIRESGEVINIEDGCDRITIRNGTITGGCNKNNGGAVYCGDANIVFENIVFISNYAKYGAGITTDGGICEFIDCRFELNSVMQHGGAVAVDGDAIFRNCEFTENQATFDGGAIFGYDNGDYTEFYDCVLKNNSAGRYGGAIYAYKLGVIAENTEFNYNTAKKRGGALELQAWKDMRFTNCKFIGNNSEEAGAIWDCNYTYFNSCLFENNISTLSGAVCFRDVGVVDGCTFTKNIANGNHPSAIYVGGRGEVTIMNSTITGNTGGKCAVAISTGDGQNLGELWIDGTVIIDDNYNDKDQEVNIMFEEYGFLSTSVMMKENFSKDSRIGISMDADDMENEDAIEDIPEHWTNEELSQVFIFDNWFGNRTSNPYYYLCRDGSDIIFKKGDPRDDENAIVIRETLDAPGLLPGMDNGGLPENPEGEMIGPGETENESGAGSIIGDGSVIMIAILAVAAAAGVVVVIKKRRAK